ncbi:peptide-binding protein [Vulcanimicrobium alpinum]|uniref:Peptide-binding protein n=1 Tax=Vulcanimicrobium alpinum TaxID=3016050 RepID=A0AAN1XYN0_UNVUL|nr:ABC transporter substrate-binding protein [Vulcanimicrobium alpinum]BDE07374.1 peptide-binding protein [Vulcanimicrobium alpinum]
MLRRVVTLIALLAAAGCGGSAPSSAAAPGHGSAPVRIALVVEPHTLVSFLGQSVDDNEMLRLIYDPLISSDARGNPIPALAAAVPTRANGGISRDGLTITYRLRSGVRWHDGSPFTSADVAASFRAVMNAANPVETRHGYDVVSRVETPDPLTVRFRLKRPFAPFVGTVFAESDAPYYLSPAHLLTGGDASRTPLAQHPVGTGPFRFVSWQRGDRVDLEANAQYWGGAPHIARLRVRFIADENTQLVGLRTGELDGLINLSANAAALARTIPHVTLATTPINGYWGIMMNNGRGPAADVRVRRAVALVADAQAFRRNVVYGFYQRAIADLPAVLWAADPHLAPIPHDPAAARALLARAGYGPAHPLRLDLAIFGASQSYRRESVLLQSELASIGVRADVHSYNSDIYDAPASQGGILPRGKYDIALYGWFAGMDPDDSGQFLCADRPPAGYNHSFYCSAAMDAAQREALASYEPAARKRAYARIEALLVRDVPLHFLGSPVKISALRDGFGGFTPSFITQTANAGNWTFSPR